MARQPTPARGLRAIWRRRGAAAWALWPLSLLYGLLQRWHGRRYRDGSRQVAHAGVPVIVVGNVIAGGAGKTPVTQAVVGHLRAAGWRPGIVSRGYGRKTTDCREARPDSPADEVGDEPALLARTTGAPVFVARARIEAARALHSRYPQVNIIVSDDGLQHLALARDMELCVFNDEGAGNGFLLPAGPLREPWPRPVTATLHAGRPPVPAGPAPLFAMRRALAAQAHNALGERLPLDALRGQTVEAVAAIARPEAFFAMLAERGIAPAAVQALPDHHDFNSFKRLLDERMPLICTEKDAVKLWRQHPKAWAVPLQLQLPDEFWALFDARLAALAAPSTAPSL